MTIDPRTPVVVGAAAVGGRSEDPLVAREAGALMADAARAASADSGSPGLLGAVGLVLTPKGTWSYHDAPGLVARAIGAPDAHTVLADVGVLQTTLIDRAAASVAGGQVDVALVVGGEAKWRAVRASIAGVEAPDTDDAGSSPRECLRPGAMIISPEEIGARLVTGPAQYALIENAAGAAAGETPAAHARAVAELWSAFSRVAERNPHAWTRAPMSADDLLRPGPANRPVALPYNKCHCSQWNVDQAGALIMCSVEAARARGVPEERWVFPHALVESNHVVPVVNRADIHRSPGFALAGSRALALAGTGMDGITHVDLYSCFPAAVLVQAAELGLGLDPPPTITGGMTFAGGPFNNYMVQSTVRMVEVLRADPGSLGLVTAISGMITKQGVVVWGSRPPPSGYRSQDVSELAAARTATVPVRSDAPGQAASVVTYTVLYGPTGDPERAVVIAALADGSRAIATSEDPAVVTALTAGDWCGRVVRLADGGRFSP